MSLNPLRDRLASAGRAASQLESPFRAEAEAALSGFQAVRRDLERRVREGELTVKVARERAAEAASRLKTLLAPRADAFSAAPRAFLDRLVEASEARKQSRERASLEALQRETNRLLRANLIEQQLAGRASEFQGRAFVRSMNGASPAPTLDSLLSFHAEATASGDEAAREWARRQLEAMRIRTVEESEVRRIDAACDRPETLNPRSVARYVEALADASPETMEEFVSAALSDRDASACAAAFALAREAPEGASARWVRSVLDGLAAFPDAALEALRAWEADARSAESEAARAQAEFVAAQAETEARLARLEAPSPAELERLERDRSRPVASIDEPIGLALNRRGALPEDEPMTPIAASS